MKKLLEEIFTELDRFIDGENERRRSDGGVALPKVEIVILGQASLFLDDQVSAKLNLAQTFDLDALVRSEHLVKKKLNDLLRSHRLELEIEPEKIWIPPNSRFNLFLDLPDTRVTFQDPIFTLVSKAIKAPEKNRFLIEEALGNVDGLEEAIVKYGGDPEEFKS
ncbi:MAG: hypothetical protein H6624_19305 [Bdellovibrionaceae bacterium]|nr:hypothetical protein [Bdellovibrionales bacterium]MCB9086497.1 hypothetical protein [Pseudobdellovibrionaceae bacterium]